MLESIMLTAVVDTHKAQGSVCECIHPSRDARY